MIGNRLLLAAVLAASLAAVSGCGQSSSSAYFVASTAPRVDLEQQLASLRDQLTNAKEEEKADLNESITKKQKELSDDLPAKQEVVANLLEAMFGTPDAPVVLPQTGLDEAKIRLAAGPAAADQGGPTGGLFRRHCVHCHGVTGDGAGPTAAFLNPYPRDFRHGNFKFKATRVGEKPTDDDLRRILHNGINGTAMPSFKLLMTVESDALVEYVKYLSIRGQMESQLYEKYDDLQQLMKEADEGGPEKKAELKTFLLDEILTTENMERWNRAKDNIVPVAPRPATSDPLASVHKGRELFYGRAACVKCHGDSAQGDGQFFILNDPKYKEQIKQFVNPSLPPQIFRPRNLRYASIRGGRRDQDLYRRIYNGIDNVGMPGLGATPGITTDDIWNLVDYIQSLPYEGEMGVQEQQENGRAN
jgi:mono/diheme cytochrome c family protein